MTDFEIPSLGDFDQITNTVDICTVVWGWRKMKFNDTTKQDDGFDSMTRQKWNWVTMAHNSLSHHIEMRKYIIYYSLGYNP